MSVESRFCQDCVNRVCLGLVDDETVSPADRPKRTDLNRAVDSLYRLNTIRTDATAAFLFEVFYVRGQEFQLLGIEEPNP